MDNRQYIKQLEDLITDELLPAYIESQRRRGLNPNASPIISKLISIMKLKREVPILLTDMGKKKSS